MKILVLKPAALTLRLALHFALALGLVGCQLAPVASIRQAAVDAIAVEDTTHVQTWLALSERVRTEPLEQVAQKLKAMKKPKAGEPLFYYGLLNQRLNQRDNWVQARDAFRTLHGDDSLPLDARILARVFMEHNQALINWHKRHGNLQTELAHSVIEQANLRRKIEELTQLEETIRTRKSFAPLADPQPQSTP